MSSLSDPFGPARRAMVTGPLMALAGTGLIVFGIAGDGLAWLLLIPGGLLVLLGLARFLVGFGSLFMERRRRRLLREGVQATATVKSVEQLGTKAGHTLMRATLEVTAPDGTTRTVTRRGAVEPQYAGEVTEGATLPVRIDPDDPSAVAVAWDEL